MSNAVNYTGLAPQLPQLMRGRPKTQAEWEQFLQQLNTWQQLLLTLSTAYQAGVVGPVTIATAKLTSGGVNGSMTFQNGALTAEVAAT